MRQKTLFLLHLEYTHDIAYTLYSIPEYQSEDAMKFVMG